MILSDRDIKKSIEEGKIKIHPLPDFERQLGPASLDVRLDNIFRVFNHAKIPYIDPRDKSTFENLTEIIKVEEDKPFVLQPGQFVLASTLEEIELPDDIGARIEGRSSWGRLGIIVHSTAGYIDPGFKGKITLEMSNIGMLPVLLYPGARICQISFEKLSTPSEKPYPRKKDAKYFGDQLPQESKIYKDFENQ
ncbi:MAG: dCTP deaminase [Candidatus Pacebacteria bacterium]|nr:dCTP deaminase [Candidatus Paceibacterota bacterium]